jgi:hypothetical protein
MPNKKKGAVATLLRLYIYNFRWGISKIKCRYKVYEIIAT